jgi:tetratricopeptide (TPR) repeat protein
MRKVFLIITALLFTLGGFAQGERKLVRSGNGQYDDGNFSEAEVQYRKALDENPNYFKGKFNLGDAMYEQQNFEESAKLFNDLAEANITDEQKAGVFYNLGNNFMQGQKWAEAVESFKRSLRLKPDDFDAKYNLEYARKKLKDQQQQQQQQNQDQNQDQDKDQDKQDQDKQDQNQDQQEKEQDQQDKEDQQQNQDQDQKQDQQQDKQQQQQQQQQISKQDAQRMLDALKNDEKKTLQKLQKEKAKAVKAKKTDIDW